MAFEGRIYVLGGRDAHERELRTVQRYCPARDAWDALPNMPEARTGFAALPLGDAIAVVGGLDGDVVGGVVVCDTALRYSVAAGTWEPLASMRVARSDFAAALV